MKKYIHNYEQMLLAVLDAIIARYERDSDYHFIDTKLDIITGVDFPADDVLRGKNAIYCWIQGRGLEALTDHAEWLQDATFLPVSERQDRTDKIFRIVAEVIANMEKCRSKNNGRMFFCMTPAGEFRQVVNGNKLEPVDTVPDGSNYSDLFYSKGLLSAAAFLKDSRKLQEAEKYFEKVIEDIRNGRFRTDQQSFDLKNPVSFVPGKTLQGPFMIALSGTAVAAKYCDHDKWLSVARSLIEHIIALHINTGQYDHLQKYDYWEAVDGQGQPWRDDDRLVCDPGHALEFVGLALKNVIMMRESGFAPDFVENCSEVCCKLLKHNFELGYSAGPGGIIKAFDLLKRQPLNTDMPWWSLPETVRAAVEAYALTNDSTMLEIAELCSEMFFKNYVNPQVYSMAYQTHNVHGVVNVIPATPDADPGYHTGLSIIDVLRLLQRMPGNL